MKSTIIDGFYHDCRWAISCVDCDDEECELREQDGTGVCCNISEEIDPGSPTGGCPCPDHNNEVAYCQHYEPEKM